MTGSGSTGAMPIAVILHHAMGRDRYDPTIPVRDYRVRNNRVRDDRSQRRNGWDHSYGEDGFPSHANGGTYFGGLSAWTDPGNGTYFRSERNGYGYYSDDTGMTYPAARPKIIRRHPLDRRPRLLLGIRRLRHPQVMDGQNQPVPQSPAPPIETARPWSS